MRRIMPEREPKRSKAFELGFTLITRRTSTTRSKGRTTMCCQSCARCSVLPTSPAISVIGGEVTEARGMGDDLGGSVGLLPRLRDRHFQRCLPSPDPSRSQRSAQRGRSVGWHTPHSPLSRSVCQSITLRLRDPVSKGSGHSSFSSGRYCPSLLGSTKAPKDICEADERNGWMLRV